MLLYLTNEGFVIVTDSRKILVLVRPRHLATNAIHLKYLPAKQNHISLHLQKHIRGILKIIVCYWKGNLV